MTKEPPRPDPNAARRFWVRAPLGMTLTDAHGHEHDYKAGAVVTWADLNTSPRHIATLICVGDIEELPDGLSPR